MELTIWGVKYSREYKRYQGECEEVYSKESRLFDDIISEPGKSRLRRPVENLGVESRHVSNLADGSRCSEYWEWGKRVNSANVAELDKHGKAGFYSLLQCSDKVPSDIRP